MLIILVPTDGSEVAMRAVRHVARLAASGTVLSLHLLNVQPPLPQAVTEFVPASNVRDYHEEQAAKALASAEAIAEEEALEFESHMRVGQTAEEIALCAGELSCDQIVMGTRGLSPIPNLLLGSTTTKLLHLATIPVTLVK